MFKRMHATNRADTANMASLRNTCRFTAALLLVFGALIVVPARAERPDIVWMAGRHTGPVLSVAFSPDGSMIASGSDDSTINLWRVSDGSLLRTLAGHTDEVNSVAFSPDGSMIVSGSGDETVRLWRVSDGSLLRTLERSGSSIALSPDGSIIASGSTSLWDYTIKLWRVSDGALLRTLEGHTGGVTSVAFSPDGSMIASVSWDETIKVWRVSDGALLKTYDEETVLVLSVAFSPDGLLLAWGRGDATLVVARNPFPVGPPVKPPQPPVRIYGTQFAPPTGPVNYQRWYLIGQVHAHWMDDITRTANEWLRRLDRPELPPHDITLKELATRYKNLGYSFLAPTEHHPNPNWNLAPGMFSDFSKESSIIYIGDSLEGTAYNNHVLAIGIGYGSSTMEKVKGLTWGDPSGKSKEEQLKRY